MYSSCETKVNIILKYEALISTYYCSAEFKGAIYALTLIDWICQNFLWIFVTVYLYDSNPHTVKSDILSPKWHYIMAFWWHLDQIWTSKFSYQQPNYNPNWSERRLLSAWCPNCSLFSIFAFHPVETNFKRCWCVYNLILLKYLASFISSPV